jgi:ribose/xylose/arabinose/galactoside ABC-type transport system permease subunit
MRRILPFLARYGIFAALVIECAILGATVPSFLSAANLTNVLRQNSFTAILAAGMTFAILTAGIDLSVGSVVALSGVLCADALVHGWGVPGGVGVGLLAGVAVGLLNGLVITRLRIPPFLVTLAMMLVVRGVARKYTNARPISGLPSSFSDLSAGLSPALIMLAVFVLTWITLVKTPFGRHVYAIGGNREAAFLSGIRVERSLLCVYLVCGLAAGLAGVLMAARLDAGHPEAGMFYELDAVAAAVVGGTSLFGGRGSIWGTLAGAFFIGVLNNGLNLHNVGSYDQQIVKGLVLLAATSLDLWRKGRT